MRFLVWAALALAGFGYWLNDYRHWRKTNLGSPADAWSEQDNLDTANAVERLYEAHR